MSSFREIKINCPACNAEGPYLIWDSVNVDLNPELKPKVMDGSLFTWVCPNCKEKFNAPYSFLYHDMTHGFMVMFDSENSHIIPFGEFLRLSENKLNTEAVDIIESDYSDKNPGLIILFDRLSDEKDLIFTILEKPENTWVFTDRKHTVSFAEYLKACSRIKDHKENDVDLPEEETPTSQQQNSNKSFFQRIKSLFKKD